MTSLDTFIGPLRCTWSLDFTSADGRIVEVFASLEGISDNAFWSKAILTPQWSKKRPDAKWHQLWEWIDETHGPVVAASDAAREAIERERLDLQREDAERLAER